MCFASLREIFYFCYNITMFQNSSRLGMLADGIFAIVMTLLVLEIKVPVLRLATNESLILALLDSYPLFLAYLLSFATLFTYWRGYHAVASDFAKTYNHNFENLSAAFLFFVALVPFSSHLLGLYSKVPAGVIIFAGNILIIGLLLFSMREYAHRSKEIKNKKLSDVERRHVHMRIAIPIIFSMLAIPLSLVNTDFALAVLTVAIVFNLLKTSTRTLEKIIEPITLTETK